ncbi:DUF2809 domain-containing protein [Neobacillus muris]|uniref:ribosomal maturation YjgA family protein n=1 Tax=Neobacillus muris TaxID=2941334 RepID=UPI00203C4DAE|nr:DUF2809 domain-containing protein [Neobacillus muris]
MPSFSLLKSNTAKKRSTYLIAIFLSIWIGLASRIYSSLLTPFIAENAGDAIWAMMVYFGFRFLLANKSLPLSLLFSFLFSFSIEFSQLYQDNWINHVRSTRLGALILGQGFLFADLFRYTAGIFLAYAIDGCIHVIKKRK